MTNSAESGHRRRRPLLWILGTLALLLLIFFAPSFVNVNHYRNQITGLLSRSLGRPVRLSSVQVRLLPWPAFELSNLSVAEDPAYGVEPVLYASTVTASIRLLPLLRGRLEIGTISVDNASLNLVHGGPGKWNLDPLFRTAAARAGSAANSTARTLPLPYLEATNSRINVKNGAEKLPFSLVNTDFELWQEQPGEWHIRLRGQPARTDVSLYQEDTGVLRLEASVGRAPALRDMPVHLDLDWRQAELGQLARLITGSDPGWRGDLTGELHLDGTANAAQITTRLRAAGVHRAEFAPAEPMDFDANCGFVYHYARRALESLVCDSPLGEGRIHLTGEMLSGAVPNANQPTQFSVELDRVPVAAGLDALRTVRSDLPADLEARGAVSGKIVFAPQAVNQDSNLAASPAKSAQGRRSAQQTAPEPPTGPLTGSLTVTDFALSGAGMNHPLQIPKIVLAPAQTAAGAANALAGTAELTAGGPDPLVIDLRLARTGYTVALHGQASLERARELLRATGIAGPAGLDAMAGEPPAPDLALDLSAAGPWLPAEVLAAGSGADSKAEVDGGPDYGGIAGDGASQPPASGALADSLSGTVTAHNVNWKPDFLAHDVEITQATLHLGDGAFRWDPVAFAYGPVKGTATLSVPASCPGPDPCPPRFTLRFGSLDAATLETAVLGVRQKATLLSDLIDRLHPSSAPPWPRLLGQVSAEELVLGPVTLKEPQAVLAIKDTGADITHLQAGLLGGTLQGTGAFERPASDNDKPAYTLDCRLDNLNPQAVGKLIGETWSGSALNAAGKVQFAGYTASDLAGSATGKIHFDWRRGAVMLRNAGAPSDTAAPAALEVPAAPTVPLVLAHFERWSADASIADGTVTLGSNAVQAGGHTHAVAATVTFGDPPQVRFGEGANPQAQSARAADGDAGKSASGASTAR
jgi:AsmA family